MSDLGNDLDMPFEENPPGQYLDLQNAAIVGGLVVMAAHVPVEGEHKPVMVFRFAAATGSFLPPILLVLDDDQIRKLPDLFSKAMRAAVKSARKANR